ncbi:hypothetical protein CC80DRAFT_20604 [Byssothecium circinans]|uniref:Uncharacterized protein n=1 Tax=Byssothecium circinans TaxID=147558 RepID=A0A6A5U4P2_9PLEO|nr:hypothetical protein CC80DRAFT_20604 [Byssothecium circinans]
MAWFVYSYGLALVDYERTTASREQVGSARLIPTSFSAPFFLDLRPPPNKWHSLTRHHGILKFAHSLNTGVLRWVTFYCHHPLLAMVVLSFHGPLSVTNQVEDSKTKVLEQMKLSTGAANRASPALHMRITRRPTPCTANLRSFLRWVRLRK